MKGYLLGVICAAFLCALVNAIGGQSRQRKLICGIFLALSILHPIGSLDLPELNPEPFLKSGQEAVRQGTEQALAVRSAIITDSLEAYILTEAARMGLAINVCVKLDDQSIPVGVTITGAASPSERNALTAFIEQDLNIGKEDLHWMFSRQKDE